MIFEFEKLKRQYNNMVKLFPYRAKIKTLNLIIRVCQDLKKVYKTELEFRKY
jgi:hypothetical protein